MLAPDSAQFRVQLVHSGCTGVKIEENNIELDYENTDSLPVSYFNDEFCIKIQSPSRLKFQSDDIKILSETFFNEKSYSYLLKLKRITMAKKGVIKLINI
jgi:hypothetical protein